MSLGSFIAGYLGERFRQDGWNVFPKYEKKAAEPFDRAVFITRLCAFLAGSFWAYTAISRGVELLAIAAAFWLIAIIGTRRGQTLPVWIAAVGSLAFVYIAAVYFNESVSTALIIGVAVSAPAIVAAIVQKLRE